MRFNEHPITQQDVDRAKNLRRNATSAEQVLWGVLRRTSRAEGIKFRRQQPIHPYIVDFVCQKTKLVIEVDGMSHDIKVEYDEKRRLYLEQKGYRVLRFSNEDIRGNLDGVVQTIMTAAIT